MNTVPDGTKVRFTEKAKDLMTNPAYIVHLSMPKGGVDTVYTIDNTDDSLHDVILRETGERWAYTWLEPADVDAIMSPRPCPHLDIEWVDPYDPMSTEIKCNMCDTRWIAHTTD